MKTCENTECLEQFKPPKTSSRFCSNACKHVGSRSDSLHRLCKRDGCGETFRLTSAGRRQVYCSRACANRVVKLKPVRTCKRCEVPLLKRNNIFCTSECSFAFQYEDYIRKWLDGLELGGNSYGCSGQVRRWVRERYGLFCWECGWAKVHPITGEPPLQIDHIDGDSNNNRPENLRLLCGGCHSLTPTYGNRGGRKSSRTYRYDKS